MKIRWWRTSKPLASDSPDPEVDLSPKRETPWLRAAKRARNGQDIEFEQILAQLRGNRF